MKKIYLASVLSFIAGASAAAQSSSTLKFSFTDHVAIAVSIDGTYYDNKGPEVTVSNIAGGSHNLTVYRNSSLLATRAPRLTVLREFPITVASNSLTTYEIGTDGSVANSKTVEQKKRAIDGQILNATSTNEQQLAQTDANGGRVRQLGNGGQGGNTGGNHGGNGGSGNGQGGNTGGNGGSGNGNGGGQGGNTGGNHGGNGGGQGGNTGGNGGSGNGQGGNSGGGQGGNTGGNGGGQGGNTGGSQGGNGQGGNNGGNQGGNGGWGNGQGGNNNSNGGNGGGNGGWGNGQGGNGGGNSNGGWGNGQGGNNNGNGGYGNDGGRDDRSNGHGGNNNWGNDHGSWGGRNHHNGRNNDRYNNQNTEPETEEVVLLTAKDVAVIKAKVLKKKKDADKLTVIKNETNELSFTTEQIRTMLRWLKGETARLEFATWAYDGVTDVENYSKLKKEFKLAKSKKALDNLSVAKDY